MRDSSIVVNSTLFRSRISNKSGSLRMLSRMLTLLFMLPVYVKPQWLWPMVPTTVSNMAQPFTYDTKDNEKELIIPAINGVVSILEAAATSPKVKRVVLTSSFASVLDVARKAPPYFTYTGEDWNPLTYEESIDP